MQTSRAHAVPVRAPLAPLAAALILVLTLAACGAAAAPSPSAEPSAVAATARPTPTAVPGDGGTGGGSGIGVDPGSGGGAGGGAGGGSDPGTGTGGGIFPLSPDPNQNPLFGDANYVVAGQGLVNLRTVNVQLVRALVEDDGTAVADLRWWSGVAPCNVLDHVEIVTDDAARTIHLTVVEGSGQGDVACIEIAELRATAVDLGVLDAGKWTISAEGDAPAISLDVP